MQAVWPMLTFYLSVLVSLGVGVLALVTGNAPGVVILKAGAALLIFSALGWGLNVVLLIAETPSATRGRRASQSGDDKDRS